MEKHIKNPEKRSDVKNTIIKPKLFVVGLLILLFGVLWLLNNFGQLSPQVEEIVFRWEMILIALGVINLFSKSGFWFGVIMIIVGGGFLYANVTDLEYNFHKIVWPLIIIFIGIGFILGTHGFFKHRRVNISNQEDSFFEDISIFGGSERSITSPKFRGGKIIAIFGGSKVNMLKTDLAEGVNELEIINIFGGSSLIMPSDWNVKFEVFNIFGGFADKRQPEEVDYSKTIVIRGIAMFGGGEIKSF